MHLLLFVALLLSLITTAAAQTLPAPAPPTKVAAAPLAAVTLENFAATPFMERPELSPNGQWLAAKLSIGGKQTLTMIPVFDKTAKPISFALDGAKIDVVGWQWVNDDWLLINVSATIVVQGEDWRASRVLSASRIDGKVNQLAWKDAAQNAGNVIWVARDGTPRILLGVQNSILLVDEFWPQVLEVNVATGKTRQVVGRNENVLYYYADATGAVRLAYGYNDDARIGKLLYRPSAKGDFKVIDRANYSKDEDLSFPSVFLPEADKALTVDASGGYAALHELDLQSMKVGKQVFGVAGYDINDLIMNASGDGVLGVETYDNRRRVNWFDPQLAKIQSDIEKAVGAGNAQMVSWDRQFQKLIFRIGSPNQAGAFYLYDRTQDGSLQRIAYVDETLKMRKLAPVTTIKYQARDGLDISAVLTLPADRPAKNLPLIVLPHGGPAARDFEGWDWWVQFLAWRGYAVVQPNFRGSTGFGKAFKEKAAGEWGLKMQDDLNDAVSHLAKQGIADPKRVCIAGASYGGYAAMRAAQRDGAIYKCAISYAGVANIAAMSRFDRRTIYGNSSQAYWKESAPNSASVSPVKNAAQFSIPLLLMHGKNDLRVPVGQSREMAAKLKSAGKSFRYVEQPLGDHHFSREADRLEFIKEMDAFLAQHNPADAR